MGSTAYVTLLVVLCLSPHVNALNNGLGLVPPMGYSSWNDCSSNVTEAHLRDIVQYFLSTGLAANGYNHINVDEGWLKGRDANGTIISDPVLFPSGMKGFGDWVHSQEYAPGQYLKYGLYTSRGTCQCSTDTYQGPGSQGYEVQDAQYFADAGADYLKEDSCCGSQDHATAFADYARMRDALNATGRPIYFSLCGWNSWYAPVGYSLGNSWRIADDGSGWGPLTNCINTAAALTRYNGPGGWNDPDLLIGPNVQVGGQTDEQARTQFSTWCVITAPLLISNNMLEASDYLLETYNNTEAIAVNQDPAGHPGVRLYGEDMSFPCSGGQPDALYGVRALACNASDPRQQFVYNNATMTIQHANGVLDVWNCDGSNGNPVYIYSADNGTGTCGGKDQLWNYDDQGRITNAFTNTCLDIYGFSGPVVDVWQCNGGENQAWTFNADGTVQTRQSGYDLCLAAVPADDVAQCTNVWGKPLSDGSWAVVMINNAAFPLNITCDQTCWAQAQIDASEMTVRDLWLHSDIGNITNSGGGFTFTALVPPQGGSQLFKFTPIVD